MRRIFVGLVPLALLVAACGGATQSEGPTTTTAPDPSTTAPEAPGLLVCAEAPLPAADPSLYRDSPKYVGNEMPVEEVRAWASQHPGFVDVWIDRGHNGWVAAGFTEDVAERQAEIEAEFPDDGVVAVEITWTPKELNDLQDRVTEELDGVVEVQGTWTDPLRGYVNVQIPVLTEENLAAIEELFPGERICVDGLPPEAVVDPGPQPQAGDGWRLLVDQDEVGDFFVTGIAWDEDSLQRLVEGIPGLGDVDVDVDFENEVAIWFGAVHGSSCPNLRLDDVSVDGDVVHPNPSGQEPEGSGLIMETGFPWEYTVDLACGFAAIGEINFYHWVTSEEIPSAWINASEGADTVVVEVLLHEGPDPTLEVTYQGETITYQPTNEAGCG